MLPRHGAGPLPHRNLPPISTRGAAVSSTVPTRPQRRSSRLGSLCNKPPTTTDSLPCVSCPHTRHWCHEFNILPLSRMQCETEVLQHVSLECQFPPAGVRSMPDLPLRSPATQAATPLLANGPVLTSMTPTACVAQSASICTDACKERGKQAHSARRAGGARGTSHTEDQGSWPYAITADAFQPR